MIGTRSRERQEDPFRTKKTEFLAHIFRFSRLSIDMGRSRGFL